MITDKEWERLKAIRESFAEPGRHVMYWDEDTVMFLLSIITQMSELAYDNVKQPITTGPVRLRLVK